MNRTALLRRTPLFRRSGIKQISAGRRRQRRDFEQAKKTCWDRAQGRCQAPAAISGSASHRELAFELVHAHCWGPLDVHHIAPVSRFPGLRCDPDNLLLLCRGHHDHVHAYPRWARKAGLLR